MRKPLSPEIKDFPGKPALPVKPGRQASYLPGQALRLFLDRLRFR
jgi:hypothetical protein